MEENPFHCAGSTKREPTAVGKPAEFMVANVADLFLLENLYLFSTR